MKEAAFSVFFNRRGLCAFLLATAAFCAETFDTRLIDAVRNGNHDTVRSLLASHVNVNGAEPSGQTALSWAVYNDDRETVELLLPAGADPNAANQYGETPLLLACS